MRKLLFSIIVVSHLEPVLRVFYIMVKSYIAKISSYMIGEVKK